MTSWQFNELADYQKLFIVVFRFAMLSIGSRPNSGHNSLPVLSWPHGASHPFPAAATSHRSAA